MLALYRFVSAGNTEMRGTLAAAVVRTRCGGFRRRVWGVLQIELEQLNGIEVGAFPPHRPVQMRTGDAASGAAEAQDIAGVDSLALFHVDAAEVHRLREQSHAVIDDD